MIVRKSNLGRTRPPAHASANVERGQGEGDILPLSPDNHHTLGRHSPVHSKLSDELREYLRDQPRLVLIGVNGVVRPFFHLPFHPAASSQTGGENNAR